MNTTYEIIRYNNFQCFKNWHNLPHGLDIYLVNVQTMRKIAPIFVAFVLRKAEL